MRPRPEVPRRANRLGGYAPHPSPHLPDSSWCRMKRRNNTGFSRIPSRLAHRARPIRQYWTDATLSRLLPPSPATPGSGYLQLHPTATTMRRWRSFTPIRDTRASWRTINFCRLRTFFRSPVRQPHFVMRSAVGVGPGGGTIARGPGGGASRCPIAGDVLRAGGGG